MTETWNNAMGLAHTTFSDDFVFIDAKLTHEQMSEMIQKHAFKLGFKWCGDEDAVVQRTNHKFLFLYNGMVIKSDDWIENFNDNEKPKAGLEFFSIKPELRMVRVEMPEDDYTYYKIGCSNWKLIK